MRVFIAGSRKITRLEKEILSRLDTLFANDYEILVGDANGVDRLIQEYASMKHYQKVTVYCVNQICRNNIGKWRIQVVSHASARKDFQYYSSKDDAMAKDADYGFMIWDGKSKGTMHNMENMATMSKKLLLYCQPQKKFYAFHSKERLEQVLASLRASFQQSSSKDDSAHSLNLAFEPPASAVGNSDV